MFYVIEAQAAGGVRCLAYGARSKATRFRGARQIGKSTLVRLFAEQIQGPLAEVNLERYRELNAVFESMTWVS